jgi:hypothetical protein
MFRGAVARLEGSAAAVKQQLQTSERLRNALGQEPKICEASAQCSAVQELSRDPPESVEWRVIDHCSAVTRLYALYEQFAHEMLREHLSLIEKQFLFTELDAGFQNAYRVGVAKILEKKDGPRYEEIVLGDLVGEFHKAVSGQKGYRLEPQALLIHEQNLRLSVLETLYQKCGINGLTEWVANHPRMIEFFSASDRMHSGAETELKSLIEYRNDAAHGGLTVDDVLSVDTLCEFADFVSVLGSVLAERIQCTALKNGVSGGRVRECGVVDETYKSGMIAVATVTGKFSVGATIYLMSNVQCTERSIESIQLEGEDRKVIEVNDAVQLGFGLDGRAKELQQVLQFNVE